ncbi:MAG: hypothetical protein EBX94_07315, partial [Burkholderiaceae bacterium]|nr:hypothetical protein [Burkholderiaceae bacterium]
MNRSQRFIFLSMLLLLGACSIQKPMTGKALRDQALPQVSIPNQFSVNAPSGPALDQAWLKQFNDIELNELVA